eukprot:gene23310-biopygen23821
MAKKMGNRQNPDKERKEHASASSAAAGPAWRGTNDVTCTLSQARVWAAQAAATRRSAGSFVA